MYDSGKPQVTWAPSAAWYRPLCTDGTITWYRHEDGLDREQYERDLRERQRQHLENVGRYHESWQPCMHDSCPECVGTGVKRDGSVCVHHISCPCPKCSPHC